jgi:hypothetical protein
MRPHHFLTGWPDKGSPMHFMRFGWIADEVNKGDAVRYELFKPWKRHDAVVFLKSMEMGCAGLAAKLRDQGVKVVFEANVDYYTQEGNESLPRELVPSARQRDAAIRMTESADRVIASSKRLAAICSAWNRNTTWVPDNIPEKWIGAAADASAIRDGRLQIWWSGMPAKLGDLLAIEEPLRAFRDKLHLNLVTGEIEVALERLPLDHCGRLRRLLGDLSHTIHRFRDIPALLSLYRSGGVAVSPRQLGNPYNQSHTEWKITLGMAAGLPTIASPQPSYLDVAERAAHPEAVVVCDDDRDWLQAFERAIEGCEHSEKCEAAADVVRRYYATSVVAEMHWQAMQEVLAA